MQWWCSAQDVAWEWAWQPYPGVWLFIGMIAAGYRVALGRVATGAAGRTPPDRGRMIAFGTGLLALWVALDWPLGALGAGYLASAHMLQFLLLALVAPPLLIHGLPPAALAPLRDRAPLHAVARLATHPVIAIAVFTAGIIATHLPVVTDTLMQTQLGSFAIDMAWLGAGVLFWWPVVAPIPERPLFHELVKILYLTAAAILMTPVFYYLTFSDYPVYALYELAPPVHGISARSDQQAAGLIMKVVGGLILIAALTVLFFRWAGSDEDTRRPMRSGG